MRTSIAEAWKSVVCALLAASASAQQVGPQRRVNPVGQQWQECSVSARLAAGNELVVCAQEFGIGVHYAVSFDGGATFATQATLALTGDSGVTLDIATDRIWLSALGGCLDGASNDQDVALFESAFSTDDITADLNQDGGFDETDVALFWDSFERCSPQ